ncbi:MULTISPECIES: hypothetical protein [unclassified Streptomyces]|uniref:hypothetical protein n=1 Tax=unclassified Streptomyces TaxID=2593676 RepID=UPI000A4F63EF|nr:MULTISPECIES: hypothetical protein [unclassified Streptomyces]
MRSLTRIAVVGAIAAAVATATTTAAVAEDATVYSAGLGAKVQWVAYGDDMYITDTEADGHSAVGTYQWGATQYFYWNRGGKGTTRKVNLNLTEHQLFAVGAMLGDWQGTPTGGLIWRTLSTTTVNTT